MTPDFLPRTIQQLGVYLNGRPEFLYVDERGLLVLTDHGIERVEVAEEP